MDNRNTNPNQNAFKKWLLVQIRYFNHVNIFLNIIATTIINVVTGVVVVGFSNSLVPLITGNYLHFVYMFLIFAVVDLLIRYILYVFIFGGIIRTRGLLLIPYYLITFYTLEMFLEVEFISIFAIFGFTLLFYIIRSWVSYVYGWVISMFRKKEVQKNEKNIKN